MIRKFTFRILLLLLVPALLTYAAICGFARKQNAKPRLLWGVEGILNNSYFANALKRGYVSDSLVVNVFSINKRENFDIVVGGGIFQFVYYILYSIARYDIHHFSFNGGLLGIIGHGWIEPLVYRLARIKTVVIAYGSDIHVYDKIPNTVYANALMTHYPQTAQRRNKILRQIRRWCRHADFVIPSMAIANGFPRWDIVTPNILALDLSKYGARPSRDRSSTIKVVHSPNHRTLKGTEYIVEAVEALQKEGVDLELVILEGVDNDQVLEILLNEADILVEKLVGATYALSGIEGMACGLPVVSNVNTSDWSEYMKLFYRYSFLDECPVVSANPDSIEAVLRELCHSPELRQKLGDAGRAYVEKYHSFESARYVFEHIYDSIWHGKEIDFMNFYHPLKSDYVRSNRIEHPLVRNLFDTRN